MPAMLLRGPIEKHRGHGPLLQGFHQRLPVQEATRMPEPG